MNETPTFPRPVNPMLRVLGIRDFRLLWIGGSISMLGSQFSLIGLPWLVLQLTGDPLALGVVLALGSIPRAIFILIGGAITDRFSPRNILLACDWMNFFLSGLAAVLVFTGHMQIWMLYILSLITGLLSGFVIPAANSIVPMLVSAEDLQAGNAITMGSGQLVGFVGPTLAGIVVATYGQSVTGIALAFALDALSFAISAIALWLMRSGHGFAHTAQPAPQENIWSSIRAGVRYLWSHAGLRFMFIVTAGVNFFFAGPLIVGIPVLADQRLAEGARAFGYLMSAYSGGNLLGFIIAGALPRPNGRAFSVFVIALLFTFGSVLASLGWITHTPLDVALMLLLGIGNGYIGLVMFTWIQRRTPKDMLGRIMSIIMLSNFGLAPLSQTISGGLARWNLTALFGLSGGLILLMSLWAAIQPALKTLSDEMVGEPVAE